MDGILHRSQQLFACSRNLKSLRMPMEQRNTEARFEHLDLPADGTCGYAKFCSRARETSMAGRRFEEAQRVERRQPVPCRSEHENSYG